MDTQKLVENLEEIAAYFSNNDENRGCTLLLQVIPMLETLSQSIVERENSNPLLGGLQSLVEAMENHDIWTMGEVIQYEILPIIKEI